MTPRMEAANEPKQTEVADFYKNQTLFVTGGTGFLGKVLIEKLLRSCPGIETMYILIRSKKNVSAMERTDQLLNDQIFQKLDKTALAKVLPIDGDLSLPGLGIRIEDRERLMSSVNVVFHSAASVRFTDPLKPTLITNLRGTAEMVKLANEMKHLKSFLYVSTAYSHCVRPEIEEVVYEVQTHPDHMLNCVEWMSEEQMEHMAEHIMGEFPNTYCFSKALAENYVKTHCTSIPVGIFRPSIVVSCAYEPLPGWNDNLNGPCGIVAGSAMGIIRTMNVDVEKAADFVPVDMVVNSMIVSARDLALNQSELKVFNFTSGARNPLYWQQFLNAMVRVGFTAPPSQALWYFCLFTIKSYRMHRLAVFLLHTVPAVMLDGLSMLLGKKRRLYKLYQRIDKQTAAPAYFTLRQWRFDDKNVQSVYNRLSPADKERFRCDIATLDWENYMEVYYMGLRKYILKDEHENVPVSLKRYSRLLVVHRAVQVVLGLGSLALLGQVVSLATSAVSTLAVQNMKH